MMWMFILINGSQICCEIRNLTEIKPVNFYFSHSFFS